MTAVFACSLLLLILMAAYGLHKLRRIHLMMYALQDQGRDEAANLYRQLAQLAGLYVDLGLSHSLPSTRGWAASPDFLGALARHALTRKPAVAVECSSGTSTVVLARCMQKNGAGMVYSLEHDPVFAQQTREQLARHGLSDWAQVLDAPITPVDIGGKRWPWYDLSPLPPGLVIDLLAVDGPPEHTGPLARFPAFPLLAGRLGPQAAVFLDDAARPDETLIVQQWLEQFPQFDKTMLDCEKGCALIQRR
jgi:hypothetical protein